MNSLDIVGIRLVKERKLYSDKSITNPFDAIEIIGNELKYLDREMMMSINLDIRGRIINAHVVAIGGQDFAMIDAKNIYKAALLSNANSVMIMHNHPSGIAKPSKEDLLLTENINKGCDCLDIKLLDHIIIGMENFYSIMAEEYFEYQNEFKNNNENNFIF